MNAMTDMKITVEGVISAPNEAGHTVHAQDAPQVPEEIARAVLDYAHARLAESGWTRATDACRVHIECVSTHADQPPMERIYHVVFTNGYGGTLCVAGIMFSEGTPFLHHAISLT